jgi:hypothetical protein
MRQCLDADQLLALLKNSDYNFFHQLQMRSVAEQKGEQHAT